MQKSPHKEKPRFRWFHYWVLPSISRRFIETFPLYPSPTHTHMQIKKKQKDKEEEEEEEEEKKKRGAERQY